jgi:hypothetical protein
VWLLGVTDGQRGILPFPGFKGTLHKSYIPTGLVGKTDPGSTYLLGAISWQTAIKRFKDQHGYVSLKLGILRAIIGRNAAKKAIDGTTRLGYVKKDGKWLSGKASMGYRILPPWSNQRVQPVELPEDMSRRILTVSQRKIREAIANRPERQHVFNSLSALSFRRGMKAVFASHADNINKLNTRVQSVGRLEDKDWWFSDDKRSGRLYHNATSLPTDCRALLLIDGQPAAETDITNCQPFLLTALYPGPSPERTRFIDLCVSGGFYEHINGLFPEPFTDRKALKVAVYQNIMYGRSWHSDQPMFQAFAKEWPVLGRIIAGRKLGQGGRSRLPVEMQSAEADLVIGRVVPRIMRELPGVPVLTIHDSLMIGARFANDATTIMREEITERFGACPPVKLK